MNSKSTVAAHNIIQRYSPAEAAVLLARRRRSDPCAQFQASPTQDGFLQSQAYYRLITGGGRAGKTTTALVDLAMCLRGIHPYRPWQGPFTALAFCISRQQAAMVVQKKLFEACQIPDLPGYPKGIGNHPIIPKREIKELGSVKIGFRTIYSVKFHNGCEMFFSWSDVDDVWKNIQGPKIGYIYFDENAGSKKLLIESRKRLLDSQHPGTWHGCMVWAGHGTEDNDAFEDYRNRCMDPKDIDHEIFQIKEGESKALTKEALDRFAATLTEEERAIHIAGDKTAAGLVQIYAKQWSDERHVLPSDYVARDEDNLWLGYDPGVDHPTGIGICAIRPEEPRRLYWVRFWNHSRQTVDFDLTCLEHYLRGRHLAGLVYDAQAGAQDKRDGRSLLSDIMEKMRVKNMTPFAGFFKSQKRHAPGIQMVRHYLDPDPYDKTVAPTMVFNPSTESGGKLARYQLLKYKGKESTKFTGEGGVVKKEDEIPDLVRYIVMQRPAYNRDWACGPMTHTITAPTSAPVLMPPVEPVIPLTNYERHLAQSKARGSRNAWKTSSL